MLTLRLPRGIWRDVLVVAASDGRPLPGITVEAGPIWTPTFSFRARATTDAHGLARVGPFPPPSDAVPSDDGDEGRRTRSYRARLYFEAELFLGDDLDVTVDGSAGEPWRMALHRGVRILGRIVDEVGRPVEGPVSLKRSEGRSLLDDWAEDGRFVLLAPPWELLATDLVVSAIGSDGEGRRLEGRSMGLPVSPEDPFDIGDIVVTPVVPSSMRTFVACLRNEEGAPLPAAWLSIGDVVLTADANGCVTAKVTADETTTASAGCRGFADKEVEIACASLEPQVITLEASRRVTGRLVDASGRGVPHVTVCHHSSSYSSSFTRGVKTDADGAFIIPVAPRCDFQVWVYVGGIRRDSNDPQFTFPAGKDHHVLSLDHDLCTPVPVEFTLHGIPDAAMPYVHAIVRATDAEWDTGASVRADPGGIWRAAEPLEPGAWRLEISLAGRVISQTHFVVPNVAPKTLSLDVEVKVPPFLEVSSRGLPGGISITWEILDASGAVARIVESSSDECIALPARPGEVAIRGIADDYSCSGWVSRRSVPLPPLSGAVVTHLVVPFSPIPMLEIRGVGDQRLIEVRRASDGQPVEKQVLAEKDGIRFALAPDLYEVTIRRGDRIERHRVDLRSLPYVLIPDPRDRDAEDD
ncbi:MAG: carboxypeptidase-like regulatory domain-containing protein [Planctomycetota bacterium]